MDTKCWCVCFGRLCIVLAQPPTEDNRRDEYHGYDGALVSPNALG